MGGCLTCDNQPLPHTDPENLSHLTHVNEPVVLDAVSQRCVPSPTKKMCHAWRALERCYLWTSTRYWQGEHYTYAGPILLSVNPRKVRVDADGVSIYSMAYINKYRSQASP